jgi:protein-S-isoprenylcysteine O-methyltransferase Ste14
MKIDPEYKKIAIKGFVKLAILLVLIFVVAGRLNYWQGWLFSLVMIFQSIISFFLFSDMPDLAKERMKPGPGMKWWDKIFWIFFRISSLAAVLVPVLDSGRFYWTQPLPPFVYIFSYLVYMVSTVISLWAMRENRFFSSVVRIQEERKHVVISSGPYQFVRHPGYVGGILMFLALPTALGSLMGLVPAVFSIVILVIRTYLEDRTLQKELPGYKEYAMRVKYRLLPGVC